MKRAVLILALAVAAYVALPYWGAYSLAVALRDGDEQALETKVDWVQLRAGLSEDLSGVMAQQQSGVAGLLAKALGSDVVDGVLDAAINPRTISSVMRNARAAQHRVAGADGEATGADQDDPAALADVRYAFFTDPNTFRVSLAPRESDVQTDLIFERSGISWPLVRLNLPDQVLAGLTN